MNINPSLLLYPHPSRGVAGGRRGLPEKQVSLAATDIYGIIGSR